MERDEGSAQADQEQIELLESLVARAREQGIRTGIRDDEMEDLDQAQAAELIEQLRVRLGEASP